MGFQEEEKRTISSATSPGEFIRGRSRLPSIGPVFVDGRAYLDSDIHCTRYLAMNPPAHQMAGELFGMPAPISVASTSYLLHTGITCTALYSHRLIPPGLSIDLFARAQFEGARWYFIGAWEGRGDYPPYLWTRTQSLAASRAPQLN